MTAYNNIKSCKKCGKLKDKGQFRSYINKLNRKRYDNSCLDCAAEERTNANKRPFKRESKKIIPIFLLSSLTSTDNKHTVKALIKNGAKIHKYEESFNSKEKAQHMIEKINADPKIAIKFLDKSKPANYKAVNKNLR